MPFCPSCRTEYREEIDACTDCGEGLVQDLPDDVDVVVIYRATDRLEANFLQATLQDQDIQAVVLDHPDHVFPTPSQESGVTVAVPSGDRDSARKIITQAREDEAISLDGDFTG